MRTDVVLVLTSFLGLTSALRRGCRPNPNHPGEGWYQTVPGDTADIVAKDFCTRPEVIKQWNNVPDTLPVGFNLKLPCRQRRRDCRRNSANGDGAYVTVERDELGAIARDFCTTAEVLARMNNIPVPDSIPQNLVIQVPCGFNQ